MKLSEIRKKAKLTREKAAFRLNVSISTINRWEAGETEPGASAIRAMRKLYKVKGDDILDSLDSSREQTA